MELANHRAVEISRLITILRQRCLGGVIERFKTFKRARHFLQAFVLGQIKAKAQLDESTHHGRHKDPFLVIGALVMRPPQGSGLVVFPKINTWTKPFPLAVTDVESSCSMDEFLGNGLLAGMETDNRCEAALIHRRSRQRKREVGLPFLVMSFSSINTFLA